MHNLSGFNKIMPIVPIVFIVIEALKIFVVVINLCSVLVSNEPHDDVPRQI